MVKKKMHWGIKYITLPIIAMIIAGIILYLILPNNSEDNDIYDNKGATFEGDVYQGEFNGADFSKIEIINEADSPSSEIYTQGFKVYQYFTLDSKPFNLKNIKAILPDGQIAYIPELKYNKKTLIAYSNYEENDYYVVHKYRNELPYYCIAFDYTYHKRNESSTTWYEDERCQTPDYFNFSKRAIN